MDAEKYCELIRAPVILKNIVPGAALSPVNFPCPRKIVEHEGVYCILNRQRCYCFSDLAKEISGLPPEKPGKNLATFVDPCPVGSEEDIALGAQHGA